MTNLGKPTRVYVQVRDPKTKKSKMQTFYGEPLHSIRASLDAQIRAAKAESMIPANTKEPKVYIQFRSSDLEKSQSRTVYGLEFDEVLQRVKKIYE